MTEPNGHSFAESANDSTNPADVLALVAQIEAARSGELSSIGCKHGWDTMVCPMRECGVDEGQLVTQLLTALRQQAQPTPEYGRKHTEGSRSGGQPPKPTRDAIAALEEPSPELVEAVARAWQSHWSLHQGARAALAAAALHLKEHG